MQLLRCMENKPEMNLRIPLQIRDEAHKQMITLASIKFQTRSR